MLLFNELMSMLGELHTKTFHCNKRRGEYSVYKSYGRLERRREIRTNCFYF